MRSPTSLPATEAACSSRLASGREPVDPGRQHRLHAGRHAGVLDRPRQPVGAALALEVAGLGELADDLLDEERVAGGALVDQLGEAVERGVLAGQVAQQLARVGRAQRLQRDLAVVGGPAQSALVLGPEVDDDQRLGALDRGEAARRASPRCPRRSSAGPRSGRRSARAGWARGRAGRRSPRSARWRASALSWGSRAVGVGDAEEVEEQRQVLGEVGIEQQGAAGDLLAHDPLAGRRRRCRSRRAASAAPA